MVRALGYHKNMLPIFETTPGDIRPDPGLAKGRTVVRAGDSVLIKLGGVVRRVWC